MAEDLIAFGIWVRLRRQALVLTREELAGRVGCAEVTIRKIEADERKPSPQIAELLATHLGLPSEQHELFVRVARGMLAVIHLPPPIPGAPIANIPSPAVSLPPTTTALPHGSVTFLFTDIEGSTRRWEAQPDAMRQALARHDAILHQVIEAHDGQVFKSIGDACCAAFAAAPDALAAAIAGQRAIVGEDWGIVGPLRVRMALHTGTADPHGGDYLGQPLNRVAHLLAAGHGGQILLSLATHELVRDHLPSGASLRDLGSHRLKDLVRPELVFQVHAPELPSDFPPLKSLDARHTNLPNQVNELIGRTREVAEVIDLLGRLRLVTLTGPGGMGKTRLALQIGSELLEAYPDGVWFVDLAPVSDPEQIASAIAQTMDLPESPGQPLRNTVISWLRDRQILLILDNCEQVIAGVADLVAELLRAAARLTVLATSRIPLRISAEQEYAVAPLALPEPGALPPLDQLSQYDAVVLFIARARAVRADFTITNANAPAVAEICVRLDGLPLAIELAAARVRVYPPEQLLVRLRTAHLQTLAGGARDLPARQQTIRNTIDWSYRLLTPAQQQLFARLGVFVGGWTIEAAEAVGGDDPVAVVEGLELLVEQSLVQIIDTGAEPRYTMLETLREYALERLATNGEFAALRQRHAAHFLALAEASVSYLDSTGAAGWLDQLEADYDNLRAALTWSQEATGNPEDGVRLVAALGRFWELREDYREGTRWCVAALANCQPATAVRLTALLRLLKLADLSGAFPSEQIQVYGVEAVALARMLDDQHALAVALRLHAALVSSQGDNIRALTFSEESLALSQALGDPLLIIPALLQVGVLLLHIPNRPEGEAFLEEALTQARALGDQPLLASVLHDIGLHIRYESHGAQFARAQALLEEAATLFQAQGDHKGCAMALQQLGAVARDQGDYARAVTLLEQGLGLVRNTRNMQQTMAILHELGETLFMQGNTARAEALEQEALVLSRDLGGGWVPWVGLNLGYLALRRGDIAQARSPLAEGLEIAKQQHHDWAMRFWVAAFAGLAATQGQAKRAARLFGAAEALDGMVWRPAHRREIDRYIAVVRALLDEATFDAAWAAGQELSLEQAIAEALETGAIATG